MVKPETLRKEVCVFKNTYVNTFSPVCTFGLFTVKLHLFDHLTKIILKSGSLSAMSALQCKQWNTITKAAYSHTSKRITTRMNEMVIVLDQYLTSAFWETSSERKNLS